MGDRIQKLLSAIDRIKQNNTVRGYKIYYGHPFKLFPNPVVELRNILIKSVGDKLVAKNHLQPPKTMFLPQTVLKTRI